MKSKDPVWSEVAKPLSDDIIGALALERWPLVITGPVGTGKSSAMACLFRSFWNPPVSHKPVLWCDCGELLSNIIACRTNKTGYVTVTNPDGSSTDLFENGIFRKLEKAALLCLDDVGVREASPAQREIFNRIMDLRADKPTILTTNLDHKAFKASFDDRSFSRALCGPVVYADGEDRRFEWLRKVKNAVKSLTN